jgi:peptidoglycan LD-endopeptidase LytH
MKKLFESFAPKRVKLAKLPWLGFLLVLLCRPGQAITSDQVELSEADSKTAIVELRQKQLIFPIQGVNPETVKGSFTEVRGNQLHHAVDIIAPRNTPVQAAGDGKIARLWLSKAGGNTIYEIDPSGKYSYYYAHLQRYALGLKDGDAVKKGQIIAFVGTSGDAPKDCPHLHFSFSKLATPGVWWPGASIDPYEVFKGVAVAGPRMPPQE